MRQFHGYYSSSVSVILWGLNEQSVHIMQFDVDANEKLRKKGPKMNGGSSSEIYSGARKP